MHHEEVQPQASPAENIISQRIVAGARQSRRRDVIRRYFGKLFSAGRRAGLIRRDIPAKLVIEISASAVQAIMNPPKMAELGLTPKTGYPAIITVIFEGVIAAAERSKR